MAINQKLTNIIEGRVVKSCREGASEVQIHFQDGSTMMDQVSLGHRIVCLAEIAGLASRWRIQPHFCSSIPGEQLMRHVEWTRSGLIGLLSTS